MTLAQMQYYKQQKGYSLDKLAELSGVPRGTLQKIFSGETKSPRYETLKALEKVLKPEHESGSVNRQMQRKEASAVRGAEGVTYGFEEERETAEGFCVEERAFAYGKQQGTYTLDDYYALPEERRVELIDGVFYDMTAPSVPHQFAIGDVFIQIRNFIKGKGGNCMPILSPVDVQLDCDDRTMVEPDLLILCDRSKMIRRCIMGAPDFVLEVLSPSTKRKDAILKLHKYRNAGVREYWMVDLKKERIVAYYFEEDELPVIYGADDEIPVGIFGGELKISMKELFALSRELN